MIKGDDVYISPSAEIRRPELCKIGNHVAIDSFFYCTTKLDIGDYVHISPQVAVIGGKETALYVEDFCFLSVGSKYICGSETFHGAGLIGPLIPKEAQTVYLKKILSLGQCMLVILLDQFENEKCTKHTIMQKN